MPEGRHASSFDSHGIDSQASHEYQDVESIERTLRAYEHWKVPKGRLALACDSHGIGSQVPHKY